MTTFGKLCPCAPELGLTELTVGAGGGAAVVTVNPFANVPLWPPGFVTVTLRAPVAAAELIAMLAVSCVPELNVQEFTVIPAPKLQPAPLWKLLPPITTLGKLCPCAPEFGLTELTVGAGGRAPVVTLKA